jgi:uncharacterized protein (DUF1800 family)
VLAVALVLPPPGAFAQAAEKPTSPPLPPGQHKSKISEEDFKTLLRLELESGARTEAHKAPTAEALNGPPLNEREKLLHVLNRMAFGPHPGEVSHLVKESDWKKWVTAQLDPDSIDDSECEKEVLHRYPWVRMSMSELKKNYPLERNEQSRELREQLPESIVFRELNSKRQFKEVMCEFWRNHFCIDQPATGAPNRSWTACRYEEDVIRKHCFGKFKNMLFASATSPAMLEFLDNYISRANAWNENYARELMELHTLGADRYYNEFDVLELSKVLTGWTFNSRNLTFEFKKDWQQPGPKTVLHKTIPAGYDGGEQALYMLATHPGTAEFISEKLCQYLVNDNPPKDLVKKVARVFQQSEGDLKKVYAAIIFSEDFLQRGNYRAKFRTPVEFTVAALRATNAKLTDGRQILQTLDKMGERIYGCTEPTGYYDVAESWMDAGVLTSRWDFCYRLIRGQVKGVELPSDLLAFYDSKKTPEEKAKAMADSVIGAEIGERTKKILQATAESGDTQRMMSIVLGSPDFQQQ